MITFLRMIQMQYGTRLAGPQAHSSWQCFLLPGLREISETAPTRRRLRRDDGPVHSRT